MTIALWQNRALVSIDVTNILKSVRKKFPNRTIDFSKFLCKAVDDHILRRAYAYSIETNLTASFNFKTELRNLGYKPRFRIPKYKSVTITNNVALSLDVVRMIEKVDSVIIGSNDAELAPLLLWIRERSINTTIIGCDIGRELRPIVDEWIEIDESFLEEKRRCESELQSSSNVEMNSSSEREERNRETP